MNTVQLITAVAGIVSPVGAIIAGAWLDQRALKRQIETFRHEMRAELTSIRTETAA